MRTRPFLPSSVPILGSAVLALAGCAGGGVELGPDGQPIPPPELSGMYEIQTFIRGGRISEEVRGTLTFADDGWVTWVDDLERSFLGSPCRYYERDSRVETTCGYDFTFRRGPEGQLLAEIVGAVAEEYQVVECVDWGTRDGRTVCLREGEVWKSRSVRARGEGVLLPVGG